MAGLALIAAPLAVTIGGAFALRGWVRRLAAARLRALVVGSGAVQIGSCLLAWWLFTILPQEGNRQGGTCASYRQGRLDEIIGGLVWLSAIAGAVTLASALAVARRSDHPGLWRMVSVPAVVLPYVIGVALVWIGLCYVFDT